MSNNMKKTMIDFQNFSFQYKAQTEPTLKNIDLQIEAGEKVLIVGPSGSGKSTLAQCINGIIPSIYAGKHEGKLLLDGKDAFELSIYEKSHLVSTVLQDTDGQFIGLSVAEDLAFALENDAEDLETMQAKVAEWSERLRLEKLLELRPQDLSGGQKQRVSLAGVLIDESPILLFDEPLANLDPKTGQDVIALIHDLHEETDATTLIIEHRLEDVLHRSVDRIVLVNQGRILYNGKPDELLGGTLLKENGIREPLYVTTLRQLGVQVEGKASISAVDQLDLTGIEVGPLPKGTSPKEAGEDLLEIEGLRVAYGDRVILPGIDVKIARGERLAIVGRNGAGKSTLAKALCQFVDSQGRVSWQGQDVSADSIKERAARIGYVLQNPNQMISKTMIFDEVACGLRLRGVPEEEVEQRVHAVLKTCGLYPFRKWPISALSYGQKKRVTIASILVLNPDVILLDEPTAGQDQRNYTEIMNFLDALNALGHTIVMITHDMQLMLEYSDRTLVVVDGQIIADASPVEILTDPQILEAAHLKETSIFKLAERLGVDPIGLTQFYRNGKEQEDE